MPALESLDLTKRQHAILVLLNSDLHASTRYIAAAVHAKHSTVSLDLALLKQKLGVKSRQSLPDAARSFGWLPYEVPEPETTVQQVRRLVTPTFADAETKEICVLAEVVNHEAARMTQLIWLTHESQCEVSTGMVDAFQEATNKVSAAVNALNVEINRLRGVVG